ncbi:Chemotaxis response regulator protein-glutamate methylesterase of group 2 operon [bioreactor metagenome]|uniref:protein-glutamate methylesterase n=2 Tax=root TaxID=1 RepID=A0A645FL90_9ZZZZ
MGKDGAAGLLEMRNKGCYTIGQDKQSCVVYGMPMVAFDIGAVEKQAPCQSIARLIIQKLNK